MEEADSVVQAVLNKFLARSALGKIKYGVTLDRTDLSTLDWINHTQEELMDAILYLEKLRSIFKPLKQSNNILFEYNNNSVISNYFDYIKRVFESIEFSKDIIISSCEHSYEKKNSAINIWINIEHTIVKPNGRNSDTSCELINDYLIRIDKIDNYISNDYVIEYSNPNIVHTNKSTNKLLHNKQIYIPPMIYEFNPYNRDRTLEIVTTFMDINQERRKKLLINLNNINLPAININTIFDLKRNFLFWQNTKILVNIHQTEEHNTFEELRCLPALLNGVIVISEDSPYKEHIPYNKYIIWAPYNSIIDTIINVYKNYDEYYNSIFINSNIKEDIISMKNIIINSIKEKIL